MQSDHLISPRRPAAAVIAADLIVLAAGVAIVLGAPSQVTALGPVTPRGQSTLNANAVAARRDAASSSSGGATTTARVERAPEVAKPAAATAPHVTPAPVREIRGRVLDDEGKPLGKAIVRVVPDGGGSPGASAPGSGPARKPPSLRPSPQETDSTARLETGAVSGRTPPGSTARSGAAMRVETGAESGRTPPASPGKGGLAVRAETGSDGSFVVRGLSGATFTVRIDAGGFAPSTREGVHAGDPLTITLARGFTLPGIVRELPSRKPVAGATVLAWDEGAGRFGEECYTRTAVRKDGRFVLEHLPGGMLSIDARAPEHMAVTVLKVAVPLANSAMPQPGSTMPQSRAVIPQSRAATPQTREKTDAPGHQGDGVEIFMAVGGALAGRVLGHDGEPVHGVSVDLLQEARAAPATLTVTNTAAPTATATPAAKTTATAKANAKATEPASAGRPGSKRSVDRSQIREETDGSFRVTRLATGTYAVGLSGEWGRVERVRVKIQNGRMTDLGTIMLGEPGTLTGRVSNAAGEPLEGADVSAAWFEGAELQTRHAGTTAEGRYRIERLGNAVVELMMVSSKGFAPVTRRGAPPGDGVVDFVLERDAAGGQAGGGGLNSDKPAGSAGKEGSGRSSMHHAEGETGGTGDEGADPDAIDDAKGAGATNGSGRPGASGDAPGTRGAGDAGAAHAVVGAPGGTGTNPAGTTSYPEGAPSTPDGTTSTPEGTPEAPPAGSTRTGTLTGQVLDAGRQPIDRAHITVLAETGGSSQATETGPDGRYTVEFLAPGTYQVVLLPAGGAESAAPPPQTALIREDQTTVVTFIAGPKIILSGRVFRGDVLLPNTSITMIPLGAVGSSQVKSTQSDGAGAYRIGLDRGGGYQVTTGVSDTGRPGTLSSLTMIVPEEPEVYRDIVYAVKAISGRITARDGSPIGGSIITASRDSRGGGDPGGQALARSGEDGAYRVEGIDSGTYRVLARATGYQASNLYPLIVSEETPTPTADLTLEAGWFLRGKVVDPQERGIAGALVVVAPIGGAESGFLPVPTDANGAFRITVSTDGPMNVTAIPRGWAPAHLENVTPPAEEDGPGVVLRANAGGSLRIRVVHREGGPVAGAQALLQPVPLFPGCDYAMDINRPPPTDAEGGALVSFLSPGEYLIKLPERPGVQPQRVMVNEGSEVAVLITVP